MAFSCCRKRPITKILFCCLIFAAKGFWFDISKKSLAYRLTAEKYSVEVKSSNSMKNNFNSPSLETKEKYSKEINFIGEIPPAIEESFVDPDENLIQQISPQAIPVRKQKTWWQLFRKRMWTEMDFLHIHAISGIIYSAIGSGWIAKLFYDQVTLGEQAVVTPGLGAMALLVAGTINCASCIPMSKFKSAPATQSDLKGDAFKNLGVGMTMLSIWLSYWFSGFYPESFHILDAPLAAAGFGTILWGIITSEMALKEALQGADLSSGEHNGERISEIIINHRVASYPNLLHLPCIYNVGFGGLDWWLKMSSKFPMQPILLFHACFALGVGNSIIFLGATMKDRKLMTLRQWLYLQVVALIPFISTVLDINLYYPDVSLNPLELYAGFI